MFAGTAIGEVSHHGLRIGKLHGAVRLWALSACWRTGMRDAGGRCAEHLRHARRDRVGTGTHAQRFGWQLDGA